MSTQYVSVNNYYNLRSSGFPTSYSLLSNIKPPNLPGPDVASKFIMNFNASSGPLTLTAKELAENGDGGGLPMLSYLSSTNVVCYNAGGASSFTTDTASNYFNYLIAGNTASPLYSIPSSGDLSVFTISNVSGQTVLPVAGTGITLAGTMSSALANNTSHLVSMLVTATGTPAITMRGTQIV